MSFNFAVEKNRKTFCAKKKAKREKIFFSVPVKTKKNYQE